MRKLFERVRSWPPWLKVPLRAAWRVWNGVRHRLSSLSVFPRMITRRRAQTRILGIYHLQEHAGYLGDMIDFLEILNALRAQHGFEKIDLAYIDDPSNPNQPISRERIEASPKYKEMMLALRNVLPSVGAVLQFDSDADFERFFRANYERYVCWPQYRYLHTWPSYVDYTRISDRGYAYANVYTPLDHYFSTRGALPKLTCPPQLLDWARDFVGTHVAPALPVALQIRFNPDSPIRNTDLEAWKVFLQRMERRDELKFVILCRREEIVPELRQIRNVIYSKDHASEVLHDLALLQVCHLSLFPDAGFVQFPWFCGLPTIYFGRQVHEFAERRYKNEKGHGFRFLTPFQKRIFGNYTADTLEREFNSLWRDLATAGWRNPYLTG